MADKLLRQHYYKTERGKKLHIAKDQWWAFCGVAAKYLEISEVFRNTDREILQRRCSSCVNRSKELLHRKLST